MDDTLGREGIASFLEEPFSQRFSRCEVTAATILREADRPRDSRTARFGKFNRR
jgi:hypothetical protein